MSELDLDLKLAARRLAWSQGYATRMNVPLRAYVEKKAGRSGFQEYTDLDVLAIAVSGSGRVESQIFDCKTSSRNTTERTFWLRGVADFFGASDAWMLRPREVTDASRQLADRLKLGVMTKQDLDVLIGMSQTVAPTTAIERLFDPGQVTKVRETFTSVDQRFQKLREYMNYDVWVYEPYRNLSQMVLHLQSAAPVLDSSSSVHVAILFDCAWLYAVNLARAAEFVRRTNASDVYSTLREYFLGGQLAIREQESMLRAAKVISPGKIIRDTPEYFDALAETFVRLYVHPGIFVDAMRYCEVATAGLVDGRRPHLSTALGQQYKPVSGKLVMDLVTFLISSAKLSPSFRTLVKAIALDPPTDTRSSHSDQVASDQTDLDRKPESAEQLDFDDTVDTSERGSERADR